MIFRAIGRKTIRYLSPLLITARGGGAAAGPAGCAGGGSAGNRWQPSGSSRMPTSSPRLARCRANTPVSRLRRGEITDLFMSCRVQRKRVEQAVFAWIAREAQARGHALLAVRHHPTDRNGAARAML